MDYYLLCPRALSLLRMYGQMYPERSRKQDMEPDYLPGMQDSASV